MIDHPHPLLPARKLPTTAQYRLLGMALLAGLSLIALIVAIHWLNSPPPVAVATTPPGTFRPTAEQRAGLKIAAVGITGTMDTLGANGTIALDEDRSTPVLLPYSGQVTDVMVEAGQAVTRGQPLLTIRTSDVVDARNALLAAAASQATTASQLRAAEANAKRQEEIYKTAGGAYRDYLQAQTDLVTAQAAARSAEAALGTARDKLTIFGKSPGEISMVEHSARLGRIDATTTLHAPISGIIAQRAVSPGQYIGAGGDKPVLTIADPTHLWLVAQLAESDAAQVHLGDVVDVTTPAFPGRTYHATIDNIGAALDPVTHRLPVRASINDPTRSLKPQMFASFTIQRASATRAMLVPAAAVIHEGEGARVWVARPDGLLEARTVEVGDATGGLVRIVAGLRTGERIVTAGAIFVNEAGLGE
jgi:cobalt-zinc-cadmium efflux system membrane fusion protein